MLYNEENIDVVMENERSKDVGPSLKKKNKHVSNPRPKVPTPSKHLYEGNNKGNKEGKGESKNCG